MSVTDLSESGTAPSAGHSKSRALSGSGDIEGFSLQNLHRRLHESSTKLTEDSCNFQARCMATRPLPVQEQIKFLSEAGLPSRPRTEPAHASHMRTYLVIRARFARLARKARRVGRFMAESRLSRTSCLSLSRFTSDEDQTDAGLETVMGCDARLPMGPCPTATYRIAPTLRGALQ